MISLKEHLILHADFDPNLTIDTRKTNHLVLHAYEWLCSRAKKYTPITWLRLIATHELSEIARGDMRVKRVLMELIRCLDYCIGSHSTIQLAMQAADGNSKFHQTFKFLIDEPSKSSTIDLATDTPIAAMKKFLIYMEAGGRAIGKDKVAIAHYEAFIELIRDPDVHPSEALHLANMLGFEALTLEDRQFVMLSIVFNVPMSNEQHVALVHFMASEDSGI